MSLKKLKILDGPQRPAKYRPPIDYRYMANVVCPYCGYVHHDSWDFNWDGEEYTQWECHNEDCERTFDVRRDIAVTYVSQPREEDDV